MSPELYWAGCSLLGAGAAIKKLSHPESSSYSVVLPLLFNLMTNIAALVWVPVLLAGFILFSWKDVLLAFVLVWVVLIVLHCLAKFGSLAVYQIATILTCFAGIVCIFTMLFVGSGVALAN